MSSSASSPDRLVHLALVGPTASGKSALALAVAEQLGDVEVVSADSMQVYRGMDIGTAKPTPAERARVPHHLLDLVEPDEEFAVAEYQGAARRVLADLEARGRRALLVGGTGLYVRAVVDDLTFPGRYPEVAAELEAEADTPVLHGRLAELDPAAAARMEPTNRRRVLRALEVTLGAGQPFSSFGPGLEAYPPVPFVQVVLGPPRPVLDQRIHQRYQEQMAAGFLAEVRTLRDRPRGMSGTARQALGYRELLAHLDGELSLPAALECAVARTRRFARRQERWFRRDPRVRWRWEPAADANPLALLDRVLEDFDQARRPAL